MGYHGSLTCLPIKSHRFKPWGEPSLSLLQTLFRIVDVGTLKLQYLSPALSDLNNFSGYLMVRSLGTFWYKKPNLPKFAKGLLFDWLNSGPLIG